MTMNRYNIDIFGALVAFTLIFLAIFAAMTPAIAQHSDIEELNARLELGKQRLGPEDPIQVIFSLENKSDKALSVLTWLLPFEGFKSDMFLVKDAEGVPARYIGQLIKRSTPTPEDYLVIPPRETRYVSIDLSEGYEIERAGTYTVQLQTHILDYGREAPKTLSKRALTTPHYLESQQSTITLVKDRKRPESKEKRPAFSKCSKTQKETLHFAIWSAQSIALNALGMLETTEATNQSNSNRYTNWFGAHTSTRYDTIRKNFQTIGEALANKEVTFDCDCSAGYFASVNPNNPYHIKLCKAFWNAPMIGTDSKAGTIVHEMSHFYKVTSTKDHAYGHSLCQSLATKSPDKAINNADSHEYFAENSPVRNMAGSPGWNNCSWEEIGYDKSHFDKGAWCPEGSFLVQLDLDTVASRGGGNSPVVGKARCCKLAAHTSSNWGQAAWQSVGYDKSHFANGQWCGNGSYLTQLDLDGNTEHGEGNGPIIGRARCTKFSGSNLAKWGKSLWLDVGPFKSHNWHIGTWCPDGSFLARLDLDGGSAMDWPVVGKALCVFPE